MKKITLVLAMSVMVSFTYCQSNLSQLVINNFAAACEWQVDNNQNNNLILYYVVQSMLRKGITVDKAQIYLVSCKTDPTARENVFEGFYSITGNDADKLTMILYKWGLNIENAKKTSSYIIAKFDKPAPPISKITPLEDGLFQYEDDDISYVFAKSVSISPTEPFFQGKRKYEGHVDDWYVVEIKGSKILITEPNDGNEILLDGTIKGGKILKKDGTESKFRFKQDRLYYNGEKGQWYVLWRLKDEN